ncbi:hypothetical protein L3Y34_009457 [Caenorhabditis briggsae]|uniref:7TM GPCR serpentine receptor class x (Srx) domain-containing protein n=1 Tax=Caenorhabditis briggsae TaxID=6238 RepID=A0AAE9D1K5_CAEBR|nr:hypothetical protein L3Y34_009457 [Caenorhabditis briggsae]
MKTQQWMGMTLLPFSLIGFIANWMIVLSIWKSKNLAHSFVFLTANFSLLKSLTQNLVLFLTLAVYYLAPQIYTDRKTAFLGSTLFWCILNAFDGLVIIKYNSDVRGYIRTGFKKETLMVVVSVGGSVFY